MGYKPPQLPRNHWRIWENVRTTLCLLEKKLGRFPTENELEGSLSNAIRKYHGRMNSVRTRLGVNIERNENGYWRSWNNVERELSILIKKLGHFPTHREFKDSGKVDLEKGIIRYHDGNRKVAQKMGYELKTKGNNYWMEFEHIKPIIVDIIAQLGHFPTNQELKSLGYTNISTVIYRHYDSISAVRERIGYNEQKREELARELEKIVIKI